MNSSSSSSPSLSSIQTLVRIMKEDIFSKLDDQDDIHTILSASAYETAWLAMVPHPDDNTRPLFDCCLKWVLNNQNELGFWGEYSKDSTIHSLPSILASLIALHKWNVGHQLIQKGLECMHANIEMLLQVECQNLPRWFTVVFPAMVDLVKSTTNLDLDFPQHVETIISSISHNRQQLLQMEEMGDMYEYLPLLSYSEALIPSEYKVDEQIIVKQISEENGSYFQSPSSTAQAFLLTGNHKCMNYLVSLVQKFPNGVPPMYPMDEEMIKPCIVNHVQRLGLAEYFNEEIEGILQNMYRNYEMNQKQQSEEFDFIPTKIYKDSLAFRILRMHGYSIINPWKFCWFLHNEKIMVQIEQNCEVYMGLMYNVYRATDILLPGENELEEARSISKKFLDKSLILRNNCGDQNVFTFPISPRVIENELSVPWIARLGHLDHRVWIEENLSSPLCIGNIGSKNSFEYRIRSCYNANLMRLAVQNYEFRQSIYMNELEELKKWSKEWGLSDMGFGREKTTYCYFAVAASCFQMPRESAMRMILAKGAIIVTVADDFYDMKMGSLEELQALTQAIHMWDCEGLSGHAKIIFKALDNLVSEIGDNYLHQDATQIIQDIWRDTFESWMTETKWSINGYLPSIDEYLETGMTSIAAHTIMLPSSLLLNKNLPNYKLKPPHFDAITKLLMAITRILNDIQSYEKEEKEGKMNLVSIMKKANGNADNLSAVTAIEDVVLDGLRKEFLKHVFMDDISDLPKDFKLLHLSCLKVFQMFFNATNRFDSETDLLHDINKAIYLPIENRISKSIKMYAPLAKDKKKEKILSVSNCFNQITLKPRAVGIFSGQNFLKKNSGDGCKKVFMAPKVSMSFI